MSALPQRKLRPKAGQDRVSAEALGSDALSASTKVKTETDGTSAGNNATKSRKVLQIDTEFQALIPPLKSDELTLLRESLLQDGCRDPLVVWNGILLDGHHRYKICTEYDIPFSVVEIALPDRVAAKLWIIRNQLGRRNLTREERAYLIGKRYEEEKKQGERTDLTSDQSDQKLTTAERIAEEEKVSQGTVRRAAAFARAVDSIAANAGEEVKQKILAREVPVTAKDVLRLTKAPPEKQKAILDKVVSGEAKSVVDARRRLKRESVKETSALKGKYRVIYADPPWSYSDKRDGNTTGAEDHYPAMTIEELCSLPVKDLAEDNAVLFLWVTSPMLEDCFQVINAWGFKYKTSFVWDKVKHNMGHYNSVRHEFLLLCTKGSCLPDVPDLIDSVQTIQRKEHSRKPEEFRQIIDRLYTQGKRIELFARRAAEGWEVWGNEVGANV